MYRKKIQKYGLFPGVPRAIKKSKNIKITINTSQMSESNILIGLDRLQMVSADFSGGSYPPLDGPKNLKIHQNTLKMRYFGYFQIFGPIEGGGGNYPH